MIHADVLGERARLSPQNEALTELMPAGGGPLASMAGQARELRRFSYRELDRRAVLAARTLQCQLGLRRGDRVGILSENRVEYLDAFFGCIKAGLVLVNLGTRLTDSELLHVIRDSGLKVLLFSGQHRKRIHALECGSGALERCVCFDGAGSRDDATVNSGGCSDVRSFGELIAELPERNGWTPTRCAPDDVCALIYTSGTTGKPKGVMLSHKMVGWNALNTVVSWQLCESDVTSVFTPLYHAAGFGVLMMPLFAVGGRVVLHRQFDADEVLATISKEGCTVVLGVPTVFKLLAERSAFATADFASLRWTISGGAPLPRYLIDLYRARGVTLRQGFGMTEAGVNCFTMSNEEATSKAGSIGRPMLYHEARIVDDEGNPCEIAEIGRLQMRGPHLFRGYFNNPQATAEAFDGEGWFDSGDLARVDEDGFFYIAGRKKEMFISGGINVYPAEIEAVLLSHPSVLDAAVVGVTDEKWGEAGVAFVITRHRASQASPTDEIEAHLRQHLAPYKLPKRVEVVDELPRTPYGKVKKHELLATVQNLADAGESRETVGE
jgi:fatty-acyl-CoA synthase